MKYRTKNGIEFENMPMEWAKRRVEKNPQKVIKNIDLIDFELKESHQCKVIVDYEDETIELSARVSMCCSYYKENGELKKKNIRWTVQGIDHNGNNIQLKIIL